MTGHDDRLTLARKGAGRLGSRQGSIRDFVLAGIGANGGFRGRGPVGDLYYTAFGLDCLAALDAPAPAATVAFVGACGTGDGLDFMHVISLARCWRRLPCPAPTHAWQILAARLSPYACSGGGFNTVPAAAHASATGTYLAASFFDDAQLPIPDATGLQQSLTALRSSDGAYANLPRLSAGTALATAGVLVLQQATGMPVDLGAAQWLLDCFTDEGGCLATPGAPFPDLLSTATALYAFHRIGVDTTDVAPACHAFADRLQRPDGGFAGHLHDPLSDCEYTFYALMTLGCT